MDIKKMVHGMVKEEFTMENDETIPCSEDLKLQMAIANLIDTKDKCEANVVELKRQLDYAQLQLTATTDENKKAIVDLQLELAQKTSDFQALTDNYQNLLASKAQSDFDLKTMLPQDIYNKLMGYYSKYENANIFYTGRTLPGKSDTYEMKVENWAQYGSESPELVSFMKTNNCSVQAVMKEKNCSFHKACDYTVMNVKHAINQIYKYDYDKNTTGFDEYWKFTIETYKSGQISIGSDCDDWSALNYVCCRIAGVPKEMLRIACGMTYSKVGHSTNYYFGSDARWHHVNSTSTLQQFNDATQCPLTGDSSDQLGLEYPWFSFNSDQSWRSLITSAQQESFDMNKEVHSLLKKLRFD